MLAFAKDITQKNPKHPEENNNPELREYMDYQRKLKHTPIVYHSLSHAKSDLEQNLETLGDDQEQLAEYLCEAFPLACKFAKADTLMFMLRKLFNGHNDGNNWYKMNSYYYVLVYDCMGRFINFYNPLVRESSEKAQDYSISEAVEIDFADWVYLYFPDLDFHIGKKLDCTQYPFAKRNQAIEEEIDKEVKGGGTLEKALEASKQQYEIDDISIKVLLGKEIDQKDLELFYTSAQNPIYDYLTQKQAGSWESMDGESLMDQTYSLGAQLKIWAWGKRKKR